MRAHSAILGRAGLSATTVNETLEALRARDVVRRFTPYSTKATTRTALWEIADPYLRFWLCFVDRRIDPIERPVAKRIGFVGSVKWRDARPFGRADALALAARRDAVPGVGDDTPLVGVSAQGFDDEAPLDLRVGAGDLIAAWR